MNIYFKSTNNIGRKDGFMEGLQKICLIFTIIHTIDAQNFIDIVHWDNLIIP